MALSGSVDGTLRVWDMTTRRSLKVYGEEKNREREKFHRDSIWVIEVDEKFENCFTGGRDGKIFKIHIVDEIVECIYEGDPKNPIIHVPKNPKNR